MSSRRRRSGEDVVDYGSSGSSKTPKRLYEIVEERVRIPARASDPLDEAMREIEEDLAREAKRLRLRELIMERRKRIKELERELEGEEEYEVPKKPAKIFPEIPPELVMQISKLPEEEREKVIETYMRLQAAGAIANSQVGALLLPWLIGYARANPGSDVESMVKVAQTVADAFAKGLQAARQQAPQQTTDVASLITTIFTAMKDLKEDFRKAMEEIAAKVQPQPSWLEQILTDDKLFQRAKELGLFGHPPQQQQVPPEVMVEIEKLRQQTQLEIEKIRDERARWFQEMAWRREQEKMKWEAVKSIAEGRLGSVIETLGQAAAGRISGAPAQHVGPESEQTVCPKCGGTFYVLKGATETVCPFCGTLLRRVPIEETGEVGGHETPEEVAPGETPQ